MSRSRDLLLLSLSCPTVNRGIVEAECVVTVKGEGRREAVNCGGHPTNRSVYIIRRETRYRVGFVLWLEENKVFFFFFFFKNYLAAAVLGIGQV